MSIWSQPHCFGLQLQRLWGLYNFQWCQQHSHGHAGAILGMPRAARWTFLTPSAVLPNKRPFF